MSLNSGPENKNSQGCMAEAIPITSYAVGALGTWGAEIYVATKVAGFGMVMLKELYNSGELGFGLSVGIIVGSLLLFFGKEGLLPEILEKFAESGIAVGSFSHDLAKSLIAKNSSSANN